jgi:hypothetical protein
MKYPVPMRFPHAILMQLVQGFTTFLLFISLFPDPCLDSISPTVLDMLSMDHRDVYHRRPLTCIAR